MDPFAQAAEKIISQQESIIGPIALEQAKKVQGLEVDWDKHRVGFKAQNKAEVLNKLIEQYKHLFGQTSVEVCREAAGTIFSSMSAQELPQLLR